MSEGYGQDVWCGDRLRTGRLARGIEGLGLAAYRRQITPRGMLRGNQESLNYGIDLSHYVGSLGVDLAVVALPGIIRAELSKDDRIANVEVVVTSESLPGGLARIRIVETITGYDSADSYELTLGVSTDGVELIGSRVIST